MSYGYDDGGYGGSAGGDGAGESRSKSQRVQRSLADYIDVPQRIAEFREKYPEGSLRPQNPAEPIQIIRIKAMHQIKDERGNVTGSEEREEVFLQYICVARRDPDDREPGIGIAWEIFPGLTTYTRRSEAMNAETSAWGRAIIASLAADAKQSVATQQEIRNRQAERDQDEKRPAPDESKINDAIDLLFAASTKQEMAAAWKMAGAFWLHDTQIPNRPEGFLYRHLWKERMDILNAEAEGAQKTAGLGEETGEPQVAPEVTGETTYNDEGATAPDQPVKTAGVDEAVAVVEEALGGEVIDSPEVTGNES